MRKLKWTVVAIIVLFLLIGGGVIAYLRSAGPNYNARITTSVQQPTEIWRDSLGVPHIFASNLQDLFFAQGYVHAQDRLFQMELFRRVIEGRLAEVLGSQLVNTDRMMRTIGLMRAAAAAERGLDAQTRRALEAYAAGVNASVRERKGALPPEFVVLKLEPEAWTVRHILGIGKMMSWDLAEYGYGLELARAVQKLGAEKAKVFDAWDPTWGTVIVGGSAPPQTSLRDDVSFMPALDIPKIPESALDILDAVSVIRASNSWVISGRHTSSGKPILANDMHLSLRAPSVWYLAALHGDGFDVAGMSLPGSPGIVAGHNRAVAWGFTNAYVDDVDLFVERVDPADSTRYITPQGSQPFMMLHDSILVKGSAAEKLDIRFTRHGPIINDVERRAGKDLIAMRWSSQDPSHTPIGLVAMNRARNVAEFREAVTRFDDPHQNIVYADTSGHIGYVMAGRIAQRGAGRRPPMLPVDGSTSDYDWNGYVPFAQHPHVEDPAEGFIVTANNRQQWGPAGDRVSGHFEESFRAQRIRELIEQEIRAGRKIDAQSVQRMQMDLRDVRAERYRDRAVDAARKAGLDSIATILSGWNLIADAGSRAAPYYYVWYEQMRKDLARSLYGSGGWFPEVALDRIIENRNAPWLSSAPAFDSIAAVAMIKAAPIAAGKTWGELNRLVIEHPLGSVAALQRGLKFTLGPVPHGGSATTVNVSHYGLNFPVTTRGGPSQRHVVDLGNIDASGGFILPSGQSGLPFAANYRDQFEMWQNGKLWLIPLSKGAADQRAKHRMRLEPASAN